MMEALKPLHHLEAEAAKAHAAALVDHQAALAEFKLHKSVKESVLKEELKKKVAEKVVSLGGVSSLKDMIKEAQKEDPLGLGAGPEEPKPVRYRTNDSSYEAIGALLVANPAGLLVERDELVSLLKHLDREEQCVARGFYLSGWSGIQPYTFDRITRGHVHVRGCLHWGAWQHPAFEDCRIRPPRKCGWRGWRRTDPAFRVAGLARRAGRLGGC